MIKPVNTVKSINNNGIYLNWFMKKVVPAIPDSYAQEQVIDRFTHQSLMGQKRFVQRLEGVETGHARFLDSKTEKDFNFINSLYKGGGLLKKFIKEVSIQKDVALKEKLYEGFVFNSAQVRETFLKRLFGEIKTKTPFEPFQVESKFQFANSILIKSKGIKNDFAERIQKEQHEKLMKEINKLHTVG